MSSHGVVCALLAAAFLGVSQGQLKPGCKIEQLRACGSDYLPYGSRDTLETSGEKFKEACVRDNQQIKCTLNFVEECLEGLPRVAAQLAIKALDESYEATCTEGTEQNKLYKNGVACMNAAGSKLHSCMSNLGDKLQRGTSKAPKKEVIHYSCWKDKKQIPCTLKFIRECVNGLPQAAALVAVKALEESIEATCVIGSDAHKKYEKAIGCMNSVGDKLHKCVNGYQTSLERAVLKTPPKEVIHYACCHYHDMLGCLSSALTPCDKVGAKAIMIGVVEQVFGETLNLVCGRYTTGSEGCRTLPKLPQLSRNDKTIPNFIELMVQVSSTIGRKN